MKEPRAGAKMLVNKVVEVAPDGKPPIYTGDARINSPGFLLTSSPVSVPVLWILQWQFGGENWRQRRRKQEAPRATNAARIELEQTRSAAQSFAQAHLGAAIRPGRQGDGHFFDRETIAVQHK